MLGTEILNALNLSYGVGIIKQIGIAASQLWLVRIWTVWEAML